MPSLSQQRQPAQHRPPLGAVPVLLALLLAMLQVVTPFAHAMLHATAQRARAAQAQTSGPALDGTTADERPCALCAADHLPALPETYTSATSLAAYRTDVSAPSAHTLSSAPLDVFCRPPPAA